MTDEEKRHIDTLKQVLERAKNYSSLSAIEKLEEENKELSQRIKELEFDVWEQKQYAGIYKSNYEKIIGARRNVEKLLDELKEKGIIKDWVYNHGYNLEVKMNELKGRLTELHIEVISCYGVIFLDDKTENGYFPFVAPSKELTDKIRKGNGHYILRGGFYNAGGTTYHNSEVKFYVNDVEEIEN